MCSDQIWVLWKSSKCSSPIKHLSSLPETFYGIWRYGSEVKSTCCPSRDTWSCSQHLNDGSQVSITLFWPQQVPGRHTTHTFKQNSHTQNKNEKILKYFLLRCVCGSSSYKIHIITVVTVQNWKLCFRCGYFKSVFEFILLWLWTLDVSTFWNPFVLCRWGWPGSLTLTFPLFLRAGIRSVKWVPMSDFLKIKKTNNILYIWVLCLDICLYTIRMPILRRPEEGIRFLAIGVKVGCEPSCVLELAL